MRIAILGSTGFLGKVLLKAALDAGYQIRTLVRNPDKLGEFKGRVEFVQGSISEVDKLEETVRGTEVVLSSVGPPQRNPEKPEFYEKAMTDLVSVLQQQHITRLIVTGGAAHLGGENENWNMGRRLLRLFLLLVAKPILIAKQREWDVLKTSDLDWTLVRPPKIVEGEPTGSVLADEKNLARTQVDVEDLANFMVAQIISTEWIKKAPLIASSRKS
jgi:putative NADH-flavin reductase